MKNLKKIKTDTNSIMGPQQAARASFWIRMTNACNDQQAIYFSLFYILWLGVHVTQHST